MTGERSVGPGAGTGAGDGAPAETLVFVDRVEGDWAVLVPTSPDGRGAREAVRGAAPERDGRPAPAPPPFDLPRALLPAGVGEGDALRLTLSPVPVERERVEARVVALQRRALAEDDGEDLAL